MLHLEFISAWIRTLAKSERGASLVEYALLVALIAVVCIAAITFLAGKVQGTFSEVGNSMG